MLREDVAEWFDLDSDSPYMLIVADVRADKRRAMSAEEQALFGAPVRSPDQLLTPFHMDIAASIQAVLDEAVLRLTRSLASRTGARNLCLAGGVALNCVANGKVLRDGKFENIWIQPAAGDAGGAVGAALAAFHQFKGGPRRVATRGAARGRRGMVRS